MNKYINLNINNSNLNNNDITIDIIPTSITYNSITYYEINKFSDIINKSVSQIRRIIKKIENRNCSHYYIRVMGKLFLSRSIKNITDNTYGNLQDIRGDFFNYLNAFDWDFFGCLSFKYNLSINTVKSRIVTYFDSIVKRYRGNSIKLFYACEKNNNRNGYHVHFLLLSENKDILNSINNTTQSYFDRQTTTNVDFRRFIDDNGGIEYLLKEIHENKDGYDLLTYNT